MSASCRSCVRTTSLLDRGPRQAQTRRICLRGAHVTKLLLLYFLLGVLATAVLNSEAYSKSSPASRRGTLVGEIREVFQRIFFLAWLGDPISLRSYGVCSDDQLIRALDQKDKFPATLEIEVKGRRLPWLLCSPVSYKFENSQHLKFDLIAPKITSCEDYSGRWNEFIGHNRMADALRPYVAFEEMFDKYNLPLDARSIFRESRPPYFLTISMDSMRSFRLIDVEASERFCVLRFVHKNWEKEH